MNCRKAGFLLLIVSFLSAPAVFGQTDAATTQACITWKKIVAREIEFVDSGGSSSLTAAIFSGVRSGTLVAYDNSDVALTTTEEIALSTRLTPERIIEVLGPPPVHQVARTKGNTKQAPAFNRFDNKYIRKYRILEQWTFDPIYCKTEIQIIGIAPIRQVYTSDGVFRGVQAVLWLSYHDAKPLLDQYDHSHPGNSFLAKIWADYFDNGLMHKDRDLRYCLASRILDMPLEKEDTVVHHLKDQSKVNRLLDALIGAKFAGKFETLPDFGEGFVTKLPPGEFNDQMSEKVDTQVISDPVTGQEMIKLIRHYNTEGNYKMKIMENWLFNPVIGQININIVGIVPMTSEHAPMFYVKFADIQQLVSKYSERHPSNTFATHIWNDYFLSEVKPMMLK